MKWRPGSEPPPSSGDDHSVTYLALLRLGPLAYPTIVVYVKSGYWICHEEGKAVDVAFWMPVPKAPKECKDWKLPRYEDIVASDARLAELTRQYKRETAPNLTKAGLL